MMTSRSEQCPGLPELLGEVERCIESHAGEVESFVGERFLELGLVFLEEHDARLATRVRELGDDALAAVAVMYAQAAVGLATSADRAAATSEGLTEALS